MRLEFTLHTNENTMEFKKENRKLNLEISAGGHNLIRLEKVDNWNGEDTVFYIIKEKYITSMAAIRKIHTQLSHKREKQMEFAYRYAGRLDNEVRKNIKGVVKSFDICHKIGRYRSKPCVTIPKASDFD